MTDKTERRLAMWIPILITVLTAALVVGSERQETKETKRRVDVLERDQRTATAEREEIRRMFIQVATDIGWIKEGIKDIKESR